MKYRLVVREGSMFGRIKHVFKTQTADVMKLARHFEAMGLFVWVEDPGYHPTPSFCRDPIFTPRRA